MRELSLHILDIAENGIRAGADHLLIRVEESGARDRLMLSVEDNGRGIPAEKVRRIEDPFVTTRRNRRVGLGLSLLAAAARRCEGDITVEARPGTGTRVTASFRRSHIDRAPLGDMAATLAVLILGHPHIDFRYSHRVDGREFVLDTRDLKAELGGLSLGEPMVVHRVSKFIRRALEELAAGPNLSPSMEGTDA
jgi:Histidine kinase-, DNA gyrase B-, and HSP90-like ATPase